jgi:hypothetical protein
LENDGDEADQSLAAGRPGFDGPPVERRFTFGAWNGVQLKGKSATEALDHACATADLVILAATAPKAARQGPCVLVDAALLRRTGAVALTDLGDGRLRVEPARHRARLWTGGRAQDRLILEHPGREGAAQQMAQDPTGKLKGKP